MRILQIVGLLTVLQVTGSAILAQEVARGRHGKDILDANCGHCHATGKSGASPLAQAPPFRDLDRKYDVELLAESLAEGIVTGHAAMPEFSFSPHEIGAIIAYIKSHSAPTR